MATDRPLRGDPQIETVTIALNYVCNSRCSFCFIEREIGMGLPDLSDAELTKILARNRKERRYRRLILAGAEATLRPDLPDIARRAREEGGFEVVRLQTNGRRLRDGGYLRTLIDAGISEYFVSCHGGDAETDARLTRNPRSFGELRAGLRTVRDSGARLITNTVVVRGNHDRLDSVADFLIAEGVPEAHFWAFIEFGDVGQGEEHVPYPASIPHLLRAVERLRAAQRDVVLSWFPECLLGEAASLQKNHRDDTLIDDAFASRVRASGRFSCPHADACPKFGTTCFGLHERYVELLGDERRALQPVPA
jgi:molybdenum cofactor biosynthesis enzyme MoaA